MAFQKTSILFLTFVFALISYSEAREFLVGGNADSWKPSGNSTLIQWAEKLRFQMGDSLIFKYDAKVDSVLEVTKLDFESCNSANPVKKYGDGDSKVELDRSGAFYFISGGKGNCEKGEKLVVVVMSPKSQGTVSPAPAPSQEANSGGHAIGSGFSALVLVVVCLAGLLV